MINSEKILVISDIHGNAEALRAVMKKEKYFDYVIFLGDSVATGPQPAETAELLLALDPDISIMGNHDRELNDRSRLSNWPPEWKAFMNWCIDQLESSTIELISSYQPSGQYKVGDLDIFMHHGDLPNSLPDPLPDSPNESFESMDKGTNCPLILFGHTHIQFQRTIGGKTYINPGSVGQPRCGKNHACYGIFEKGIYSPCHVSYDQAPWLKSLEKIEALNEYPDFKDWLRTCFLSGYGIGKKDPWTRFGMEGYY